MEVPTAIPTAAPVAAPSFNFWPWLLGLLALGAILWWMNRPKTVYTTNVTSPMRADVTRTTTGTTVDDYAARLRAALSSMDDSHRASFVQQLSQAVTENRGMVPDSLVQSTKAAFAAGAGGSSGSVSSLINLFRDHPQLLQAAVRKYAAMNPGELAKLL